MAEEFFCWWYYTGTDIWIYDDRGRDNDRSYDKEESVKVTGCLWAGGWM